MQGVNGIMSTTYSQKMFTLGESEQKGSRNSYSISVTLQLLCQSKKIKEKQNVFET